MIKAWGEFVERYSLFRLQSSLKATLTSSGFASHSRRNSAREAAVCELIERDVFLCSWLLRLPATEFYPQGHQIACLAATGYQVRIGILGRCMGVWAGIIQVASQYGMAVTTAAKSSLEALTEQLTREARLHRLPST